MRLITARRTLIFVTLIVTISIGIAYHTRNGSISSFANVDSAKNTVNYYPLEIGNRWDFEKHYYDLEQKKSGRFTILITAKSELKNGLMEYRKQENKPFLMEGKEGILTPAGVFLLKYPLVRGARWISGKDNTDQRLFKIEDVGFSVTVQNTTYDNCISVIVTSDYHAMLIEGKTTYLAFESRYTYAPNVGPVFGETYEMKRSGERKLVSRMELINFQTQQPVTEKYPQITTPERMVRVTDAFRYPKEGFIHPILSPDDKWLVYQITKTSFFEEDRFWKELYYTKRDRSDQNVVPLFPPDKQDQENSLGVHKKWSPNGKILAATFEIGYKKWIGLVDFSGDRAQFLECFRGIPPLVWGSNDLLLYIDEYGNIVRRKPGNSPEYAVFFRSSYRGRDSASNFQIGSNGTIIYSRGYGSDSIYMTNVSNPSKRVQLAHKFKDSGSDFQGLKFEGRYDLSPTGEYGVFYLPKEGNNSKAMAVLIDLRNLKIVDKFSVKQHSKVRWSPDGSKLAYLEDTLVQEDQSKPSGRIWPNPHFYILDVDTGQKRDYGLGVTKEFNWTPDGRHIIYSMRYSHPSASNYKNGVFIMSTIDGKDIGRLGWISASFAPVVSPSGKYIVWKGLNMYRIFVIDNPYLSMMGPSVGSFHLAVD